MAYKKIASMEPQELESAIAWGIYKGGLSLAVVLFILWIFMPFILPLALLASGYATENWLEPFVNHVLGKSKEEWRVMLKTTFWLLLIISAIWTSIYLFSKTKIYTKIGNWFNYRLAKPDGGMSDWRLLGLVIGFISAFIFALAAFAHRTMLRVFNFDDFIFLLGSFLISCTAIYFSLRKRKSKINEYSGDA
jgi:hypothetical protein